MAQQHFASQSVALSARLPRRKIDPVLSAAKKRAEFQAGFSTLGRKSVIGHLGCRIGGETHFLRERKNPIIEERRWWPFYANANRRGVVGCSPLVHLVAAAQTGFQLAAERQHLKETIIQRYLGACTRTHHPLGTLYIHLSAKAGNARDYQVKLKYSIVYKWGFMTIYYCTSCKFYYFL